MYLRNIYCLTSDVCHRNWSTEDFETGTKRIFLECDHCGEKFKETEKNNFIGHMRRQHTKKPIFKCHICSRSFKAQAILKEHIEGVHKKKFKCEKCKSNFHQKRSLVLHIRVNCCKLWSKDELEIFTIRKPKILSKKNLACHICSKIFKFPCNLKKHIAQVHEKKVRDKCEICGKIFYYQGGLVKHLRFNKCRS